MCTCLEFTNKHHYFGRTLDLEYHYNEEAVITPRNYEFKSKGNTFNTKYALIGTAMVVEDYPFYYEAANECGLAMAGLNFPNNAKYNDPIEGKLNLAAFELVPYILGNYKDIRSLRADLANLNITNLTYNEKLPVATLHFMISDENSSIVLEQTKTGLKIYENPYGVMTNNPEFFLQVENLNKYITLTNEYKEPQGLNYTCGGLGGVGLPGDYSSMSRFVRVEFLRRFRTKSSDELASVSSFFHILGAVSMVSGSVLTAKGLPDKTYYTSCINTSLGIYYYRTYDNFTISSLALNDDNMNQNYLTRIPLDMSLRINKLN